MRAVAMGGFPQFGVGIPLPLTEHVLGQRGAAWGNWRAVCPNGTALVLWGVALRC